MQLTRYTDYALRVLMYLGVRGERLATITKIAECYDISRNHVMKVVYDLGRLGYIETIRGRNGGIRLRVAPELINVGTMIRHMENGFALVECFGTNNQCRLTPVCALSGAVGEALAAFFNVLDGYTLADLLEPRARIVHQLGLAAPERPTGRFPG
jgi:Rrf2 family nitric oxide-sensitive transcriptional repressor